MGEAWELTLDIVEATRERLRPYITETPLVGLTADRFGLAPSSINIKLEMLQRTGSFKFRGAINNLLCLEPDQIRRGVITVSSGNHGIAVAEAARQLDVSATVVMSASSNAFRRDQILARGANVVLAESVQAAFDLAEDLRIAQGLALIHPYDGVATISATAALGLELVEQTIAAGLPMDAIILPLGGGGFAAGVAWAVRAKLPEVRIFGAEPVGAPTVTAAMNAGFPILIDRMETIADSLGAPIAGKSAFEICRNLISQIVLVTDREILIAQDQIWSSLKLAIEPSAAVSTAALMGILKDQLSGLNICLIYCGANLQLKL